MKILRTIVLGCGILLAGPVGAQEKSDARTLLVGKWESTKKVGDKEFRVLVEFAANNKVHVAMRDFKADGVYKFLDDKTIEIELTCEAETKKVKTEVVKITREALELKDAKGKIDRFTRTK